MLGVYKRGDTKVMPPFFPPETNTTNNNAIYIYHGFILYKVEIIFAT